MLDNIDDSAVKAAKSDGVERRSGSLAFALAADDPVVTAEIQLESLMEDDSPEIEELLELAGTLDIAKGAWLCRIGAPCTLDAVIARIGRAPAHEVAELFEDLDGLINLSDAVQPFQWIAAEQTYLICPIGESFAGHLVLVCASSTQAPAWSRAREIARRIQRLVYLGFTLGRSDQRPARSEAKFEIPASPLVDLCPFGMLVIDGEQRVEFANLAAQQYLDGSGLISSLHGRLTMPHTDDAIRFHSALGRVLCDTKDNVKEEVLAVSCNGGRRLLLTLARLPHDDSGSLRAGMIITDPDSAEACDIRPLAQLFSLTPVEIRVVSQLVKGRSVQETAQALKLKLETVRTYLKQVFQKTGTHRQLDLVRLMTGGNLPRLRG